MIKNILIGILAAIGLFFVITTVYLNTADCHKIQKAVVTSPDGKYAVNYNQEICKSKPSEIEAWVYERNSKTSKLIFSALATTTEQIQIKWKNEYNILINYPKAMNPIKTNNSVYNLEIQFRRGQ